MAYTASRSPQHDFWLDTYNTPSLGQSYQEQRYSADGAFSTTSPRSPGLYSSVYSSADYHTSAHVDRPVSPSGDYRSKHAQVYNYNRPLGEAPGYMRHTTASSSKATSFVSTPKAASLSPTTSSTPKSPPFSSIPTIPTSPQTFDTYRPTSPHAYDTASRQLTFGTPSLRTTASSVGPVSPPPRAPATVSNALIRAQAEEDVGKYTIVFDLDETLVHAREGPVRVRPGARELMQSLAGKAEVILWTAGERNYAQNAVRVFDSLSAVRQIVARDHRWCKGFTGGTKDLRRLGRDTSRTLIIENTAECVRANTDAAVLVPDYNGKGADSALRDLAPVLMGLLQSGRTVQDYLASHQSLTKTLCRIPSGETFTAFNVRGHVPTDAAR